MAEDRPSIPAEIEREVFSESGRRCAVCGATAPLELAHIINWSDEKRHRASNLICLCRNCHGLAHDKKWTKKELKRYKANPWVHHQGRQEYEQISHRLETLLEKLLQVSDLQDHPDLFAEASAAIHQSQMLSDIPQLVECTGLRITSRFVGAWQDALVSSPIEPSLFFATAYGRLLTLMPELEGVLDDVEIPDRKLRRIYHECAPRGWRVPSPVTPESLLIDMAYQLARAGRQTHSSSLPILDLLHRIARLLPGRQAAAVQTWIERACRQVAVDDKSAASLAGEPATEGDEAVPHGNPFLLVQAKPEAPGVYNVKAWFSEAGKQEGLYSEATAIEEMAALMSELLEEVADRQVSDDPARVELLLPRELMCADVDQWPLLVVGPDIPIGNEHQVVVRPLERAQSAYLMRKLSKRWQMLEETERCICFARISSLTHTGRSEPCGLVIGTDDQCGGSLTRRLINSKVICAVMTDAPAAAPVPETDDALDAMIKVGIGVMLWVRDSFTGDDPEDELRNLVEMQEMKRLPDRIWDLRQEAIEEPGHIGGHITLLWDNPSRPFPDFDRKHRLRAPAKRG